MVDLTSEMAALWAALGPAPAHRGRVIQIAAANTGEGVSTVAREYARLAAVRARRPVWLIDGDLAQQGQLEAVLFREYGERYLKEVIRKDRKDPYNMVLCLSNDIYPMLGHIPLDQISIEDIRRTI